MSETNWTAPEAYRAWRPLLVPGRYGASYPEDFDRNKRYEFRRAGSDEVEVFRLSDSSPYFNVAGLSWRELVA